MALTDEDKTWIKELLSHSLERFSERIGQQLGQQLREQLDEQLNERLEALETRLLTAFHGWASPMEARIRSHAAVLRALDLEQENLSDRIKHLEEGKRPQ